MTGTVTAITPRETEYGVSQHQAEHWMIGQLIQYPEKIAECRLNEEHFLDTSNRMIFRAIQSISSTNRPVDVVSVADEVIRTSGPQSGDQNYWLILLGQIIDSSFSGVFFESSQRVLIARHRTRRLKQIAQRMMTQSESGDENEIVDTVIRDLMDLDTVERKYTHTAAEAAMAAFDKARESMAADGVPGLRTGIRNLDELFGGFKAPDLIVVGARPAMGKAQPMYSKILLEDGL